MGMNFKARNEDTTLAIDLKGLRKTIKYYHHNSQHSKWAPPKYSTTVLSQHQPPQWQEGNEAFVQSDVLTVVLHKTQDFRDVTSSHLINN
jgi:hypothetical protein